MRRRTTAEGSSRIHEIVVEELHDDEGVDTSLYVVERTEGRSHRRQFSNQNENLSLSSQETGTSSGAGSQDQDLSNKSEPTDREKLELQQFGETLQRKMTALQQHFYKMKEVASSSGASVSDAQNHQERASVEETASGHGENTGDSSGHGSSEGNGNGGHAAIEEAASGHPSLGGNTGDFSGHGSNSEETAD